MRTEIINTRFMFWKSVLANVRTPQTFAERMLNHGYRCVRVLKIMNGATSPKCNFRNGDTIYSQQVGLITAGRTLKGRHCARIVLFDRWEAWKSFSESRGVEKYIVRGIWMLRDLWCGLAWEVATKMSSAECGNGKIHLASRNSPCHFSGQPYL